MKINQILATELHINLNQVDQVITLIDDGNTIPFIARYRKELTGGLDDELLRNFDERLTFLRSLMKKRDDIIRLISEQGKMTDEINRLLDEAKTITELDDIYRPFRPKRRTRATIAKEKGLEPLADILMTQLTSFSLKKDVSPFINQEKKVLSVDDALNGAMDIIAENISDNAEYRKTIRSHTYNKGVLITKAKTEEDSVYRLYYDFNELIAKIPSHRLLAINRGEKESILSVKIDIDEDWIINYLSKHLLKNNDSQASTYIALATTDAYKRLIAPSIQNEIRNLLTTKSEEQAIAVFKENLKALLLQPPIHNQVVMGFDPAYRTGCKIAIVDSLGDVLAKTVVYPTAPQNKTEEAEKELLQLIEKYQVNIISIGNGTASKESEIFVAEMIKKTKHPVNYIMTNEAGASVYSASKLATEEFPQYDVSIRSAISIARRIQDPLAELVKIDPKSIGVGQYQHDMPPKQLSESLDGVVENCVSTVGADLNTASVALLSHIAGINSKVATNIIKYRTDKAAFSNRDDLLKISGIKEKTYTQCVGFLRVYASAEILDNTAVHPESYQATKKLLAILDYHINDVKDHNIKDIDERIRKIGLDVIAKQINIGIPTLNAIITELKKPGRDPRDELPQPILRSDIMDISYLKPGMILTGTVRNVADFGAFVDIGVHQDGLVHISKLSKNFVKRALDVISIGDIIKVRVIEIDIDKKRISLERIFD